MNRGSELGPADRSRRHRCFNEAPIHESGKFERSMRGCPGRV